MSAKGWRGPGANCVLRSARPLAGPGWLLCGDAAANLDPAAGQGVFTALWTGLLAARTAREIAARPELEAWALAAYDGEVLAWHDDRARELAAYDVDPA